MEISKADNHHRAQLGRSRPARRHWRLSNFLLGLGLCFTGASAHAANLKLIEVATGGETDLSLRIPLANDRVILSADDDGDGVYDIFSVSLAGGDAIRLNEPLVAPFTYAYAIAVTSDGERLVYGLDGDAGLRLYSVPTAGPASASIRLDQDVTWDLDFSRPLITGDDLRLVFTGNQLLEDTYELFSVPVLGPANAMIRLNEPLESGGVNPPSLSSDGLTLVYYADEDPNESFRELYSVQADGANSPVRLSIRGSLSFNFVATNSHAIYTFQGGLYSVPLNGPAEDSVPLLADKEEGDTGPGSFLRLTPDEQTLVYEMNNNSFGDKLFSVPVTGPASANVQITPTGQNLVEYQIAGNERVVYRASREEGGQELWSTPTAGPSTSAVQLSPEFGLDNGGASTFQVAPDNRNVVYQGSFELLGKSELWRTPMDGPANSTVRLSPLLPDDRDVFFDFVISPDGQRVAYRMDLEASKRWDLYTVPIDGPPETAIKLNGPLASGGDVCGNRSNCFQFAPDSRRVYYEAEVDADRQDELFIADEGLAAAAWTKTFLTAVEGTEVMLPIDIGTPSVFTVSLDIVPAGGTASEADYSLSTAVQIPPGQTMAQIPLTVNADGLNEPNESLRLRLDNVENAALDTPEELVISLKPEGFLFFGGFEAQE